VRRMAETAREVPATLRLLGGVAFVSRSSVAAMRGDPCIFDMRSILQLANWCAAVRGRNARGRGEVT
jgi:hypothetical protein